MCAFQRPLAYNSTSTSKLRQPQLRPPEQPSVPPNSFRNSGSAPLNTIRTQSLQVCEQASWRARATSRHSGEDLSPAGERHAAGDSSLPAGNCRWNFHGHQHLCLLCLDSTTRHQHWHVSGVRTETFLLQATRTHCRPSRRSNAYRAKSCLPCFDSDPGDLGACAIVRPSESSCDGDEPQSVRTRTHSWLTRARLDFQRLNVERFPI